MPLSVQNPAVKGVFEPTVMSRSDIVKYRACYDAIERRNQSGKIIQDKVILFLILVILEDIHVDI